MRDIELPAFDLSRYAEFKVAVSQVAPMDIAFESMTVNEYELLVMTIYRLNDLIEVVNKNTDVTTSFIDWLLNEGLQAGVLQQLNVWLADGTLEGLINQTIATNKLEVSVFDSFISSNSTQLALKETIANSNAKLALKENITDNDVKLALKENITDNDVKLALKENIVDNDAKLALKENITDNNAKLLLKADKTYVDTLVGSIPVPVNPLYVSIKDYGAVGNGVADDTQAFKNALTDIMTGNKIGHTLLIDPTPHFYKITQQLTITKAVTIIGGHSRHSDIVKQVSTIKFTGNGFVFSGEDINVSFENLIIIGTSKGSDWENNNFGNAGFTMSAETTGKFKDLFIEGFDIGVVSYQVEGRSWAGAYRYFDGVMFRSNKFNLVQKDYTTHQVFTNCEFRVAPLEQDQWIGRVIIHAGVGYSNAFFTGCLFEGLGRFQTTGDYQNWGINVFGKTDVSFLNCYFENVSIYGREHTNIRFEGCYLHVTNTYVASNGYFNLDGSLKKLSTFDLGRLDDPDVWKMPGNEPLSTVTFEADPVSGYNCYKIEHKYNKEYSRFQMIDLDDLKRQTKFIKEKGNLPRVKFTITYRSTANKNVFFGHFLTGYSSLSFSSYDKTTGWITKSYLSTLNDFPNNGFIAPTITMMNPEVGDIVYIKDVQVEEYAR